MYKVITSLLNLILILIFSTGSADSFEIPYAPHEGASKRIIISVTFNESVTSPMAIDTGSPGMIISPKLAEKIGIFGRGEANLIETAGGIGGSVPAIRTIIDSIQVGEAKVRFIPAIVTPLKSDSFEGLIGMDFMSGYYLRIDPVKNIIVFEEIPPDPDHPGGRSEQWWRNLFMEFSSARSEWKEKAALFDKLLRDSPLVIGGRVNTETLKINKEFADNQYKASDNLLDKLDRYANENYVPRNWR